MAVQQNKKSRSARDMRRSHDALEPNALSVEKSTGEVHLRHHVSPDGFYRGRKVIDKGEADKIKGANKFFFAVGDPDEAIFLKCGQDELTLAQLQSLGFERMSTAQKLPDYASILLWARDLLGLEGGDGG